MIKNLVLLSIFVSIFAMTSTAVLPAFAMTNEEDTENDASAASSSETLTPEQKFALLIENIKSKDLDSIEKTLEKTPSLIDQLDPTTGGSLLHFAIFHKQRNIAKFLIKHHPKLAYRVSANGASNLHQAISSEEFEIADILIEQFPDLVNKPNTSGVMPLHFAAFYGYLDVAKKLIFKKPEMIENQTSFAVRFKGIEMPAGSLAKNIAAERGYPDLANFLEEVSFHKDLLISLKEKNQRLLIGYLNSEKLNEAGLNLVKQYLKTDYTARREAPTVLEDFLNPIYNEDKINLNSEFIHKFIHAQNQEEEEALEELQFEKLVSLQSKPFIETPLLKLINIYKESLINLQTLTFTEINQIFERDSQGKPEKRKGEVIDLIKILKGNTEDRELFESISNLLTQSTDESLTLGAKDPQEYLQKVADRFYKKRQSNTL